MPGRTRCQRIGEPGELVGGQRMGHDQDTKVGTLVVKELDRQADEVVAVPGDEAAAFPGSPLELLTVRKPFDPYLMGADGIYASTTEELSDLLAEILIQVVFQRRSATSEGCRSASRLGVQASFRAICRSISSGYAL